VLYRQEDGIALRERDPIVLVQTERFVTPDIEDNDPPYVTVRSKSVEFVLRRGGTYRFRARVNPVRSLPPKEPGQRGKRVGVYEASEQQQWFEEQMAKRGLAVRNVVHRREPWRRFQKRSGRKNRRLTFSSAFFEGLVEVLDSEKAERAVVAGIGPGKGFGFGLLSLAGV
jgi:CRISPR system Cascade subunit CasE